MSWFSWPVCLLILLAEAFVLSLLLTPLARRIGQRAGFMDQPGERKIHHQPIPRSGGMAIFASFIIVLLVNACAAWLLRDRLGEGLVHAHNIPSKLSELGGVLAGAIWIFFVGVIDDRRPLSPRTKLICQLLATLPLLFAGVQLTSFLPPLAGKALTVCWVVLIINSLNLLDNMDGLSAGIAAICSAVFAWIAFSTAQWYIAAMFVILAGSLLGFLRYNFNPASVFMGDGGSMFIGYMLATLAILTTYYEAAPGDMRAPTGFPVIMPIVVLGVPIFDTVSVCWIRCREGRPLSQGDTSHFSHRLAALGLSQRKAVLFIYLVTACVGLSALPFQSLSLPQAIVYSFQIVLWFLIIFNLERLGLKNSDG